MFLFYFKKAKRNPKEFKIKVKFSNKSEEEKEKLLFQVFDLLLSKKKTKPKENQDFKAYPMLFLTKDMIDRLFSLTSNSTKTANK